MVKDKYYMEGRARETLIYVCGQNSENLELSDKPDIQNAIDNIGIEVVQDVYEDEMQSEREIAKIWDKPYHSISPKILSYYKRNGRNIIQENDRIKSVSLSEKPNTPEHLISTIQNKINKLNTDSYKKFASYELYVFVDTVTLLGRESLVTKIVNAIANINSELFYKKIYLDCWFELYICDMIQRTWERKDISPEMRKELDK